SAVKLDPENPLYHFQLGSVYAKYRHFDRAIEEFLIAKKIAPNYEDIYLELAAVYMETNRLDPAYDLLRRAIRLKPGDFVARLMLGSIYRRRDQPDRAQTMYRDALQLTPGGDINRLSLAAAFRGEKSPAAEPDPLEQFKKNLEQIPRETGAHITVEMVSEQQSSVTTELPGVETLTGERTVQFTTSKHMIELLPADSSQRTQDINRFMETLEEALSQHQQDESLRINMDIRRDERIRASKKKKSRKPSKPVAVYQPRRVGNDAGLWVMGTSWMRIIDQLILADTIGPAPVHLELLEHGIAYLQLGRADQAQVIFDELIEQNPDYVLAWQGRAVAFVELGEIQEAISCYQKILSLDPGNTIAKKSIAWLSS
ncbi:MAG: tetratricopeptide repeat protein, partial [Elusimicrobia bacterium]|nr:tetratricopeptide repeat protein [Elusimicrobiota bacterium]